MKIHIAKLLLKDDIVTKEQIKEAVDKANSSGMELSEALIELGYLSEPELLDFLGNKFGVPVINIDDHSIDQDVLKLIPREMAIENQLIPLSITGSALTVAMSDPSNIIIVDELSFLTEKNIIPVVVSERSIIDKLKEYYGYSERKRASEKLYGDADMEIQNILNELNESKSVDNKEAAYSKVDSEVNFEIETEEDLSIASDSDFETINPPSENSKDSELENIEHEEKSPESVLEVNQDTDIFAEPQNEPEHFSPQTGLNDFSTPDGMDMDVQPPQSPAEPREEIQLDSSSSTVKDIEPSFEEVQDISAKDDDSGVDTADFDQTVLVIDNSRTVQKLVSLSLERSGYNVSSVSDGMEALSCLNDLKPNLIFLDINLKNMDGYRVCKVIKSHALMKRVPIIMLSGKDGLVDKMRSKMAGADGYLTKPFTLNDIKDTANRFIETMSGRLVSGQD